MDATEIKRRLADQTLNVCQHLLPAGTRETGEWCVGDVSGTAGRSLKVHLSGPKAGVWSDFAEGVGGDLIDLWQRSRGLSLVQALDEIRGWLGIERPHFEKPAKTWKRPKKPECRVPKARVLDYLREERNIPQEILTRYHVGEQGEMIVFPFLDPDGNLIMAKVRKAEDGAKPKPTEAECEKILFGWQAIDQNAREVVITEGEIDALSMAAYGFPAMSVPYGGGGGNKQDWIESEYDRLDRFETIFLALDMDREGQLAVAEISSRLGCHRCRVVELPKKDANECLMDGVSREDIAKRVAAAKTMDPPALRRPVEFQDQVVALFYPKDGVQPGYTIPYGRVSNRLRFRPSEVTVWSGATGSGKSQILSDCAVDWIWQGSRVCMASLEMHPAQTLRRMVRQVTGTGQPTESNIVRTIAWLNDGLWLFDLVGKTGVDGVIEVFEYARRRYGCDQFIIDSLMRLGVETDDYNGQEKTMFRVVDWAISAGVHVHFVAHSRKADMKQSGPQGTEDIKGAMELGANAFNILTVWRNRKLEDDINAAETDEERAVLAERPGVVLNVTKQRNGDWEGKVGLWFNPDSYRYRSSGDDPRFGRNYVGSMAA